MIYVTKSELCDMDDCKFVGQTEVDTDGNYVSAWEVVDPIKVCKTLVLLREHTRDAITEHIASHKWAKMADEINKLGK